MGNFFYEPVPMEALAKQGVYLHEDPSKSVLVVGYTLTGVDWDPYRDLGVKGIELRFTKSEQADVVAPSCQPETMPIDLIKFYDEAFERGRRFESGRRQQNEDDVPLAGKAIGNQREIIEAGQIPKGVVERAHVTQDLHTHDDSDAHVRIWHWHKGGKNEHIHLM